MKVLIATRELQGDREDDFSRTVDGELVYDSGPCLRVRQGADWLCECAIAFRGVASGELTTTAIVADLPLRPLEYERAFRDGFRRHGHCADCARKASHAARTLAMRWPVGTIVERDQLVFLPRPA